MSVCGATLIRKITVMPGRSNSFIIPPSQHFIEQQNIAANVEIFLFIFVFNWQQRVWMESHTVVYIHTYMQMCGLCTCVTVFISNTHLHVELVLSQ